MNTSNLTIQQRLEQEKQKSKLKDLTEKQINYIMANHLRNQDPDWLKKQEEIYKTPEFAAKISEISKANWEDPDFQKKQHESRKAAWANDEDRRKQVIDQFSQPKTKSHRKNIGKGLKDFYATEEGKKRKREQLANRVGVPRKIVTCPHCNKKGGEGIMMRWHFDNCKQKN